MKRTPQDLYTIGLAGWNEYVHRTPPTQQSIGGCLRAATDNIYEVLSREENKDTKSH